MNRNTILSAACLVLGVASCGDAGNRTSPNDTTTSQRVEDDVVRSGQAAADQVHNAATDVKEMTAEEAKAFGDNVEDAANATADKAKEAKDATADKASGLWNSAKDGFSNALDKAKQTAGDAADATSDAANNAWESTKDGANTLSDQANQAVGRGRNEIGSLRNNGKGNDGIYKSREELEAHKARVRADAEDVANRARAAVAGAIDGTQNVGETLVAEASDSLDRTQEAARSTANDVSEGVQNVYEGATETVANAYEGTKDGARGVKNSVTGAVAGSYQWTKDRFNGGRQAVNESLERIGNAAKRPVDQAKESLNEAEAQGRALEQQTREELAAQPAPVSDSAEAMGERGRALAESQDIERTGAANEPAPSLPAAGRITQEDGVARIAQAVCERMNARKAFGSTKVKYATMEDCLHNEEIVLGSKYFGSDTCVVNGFVEESLQACVEIARGSYSSFGMVRDLGFKWNCDSEYVCRTTP